MAYVTSGLGRADLARPDASPASVARSRARSGRNYRAPRNELRDAYARLAATAPGASFESRASRELRSRVASERSTVLLAPDGTRAARRIFRRERDYSRPGTYRTLAIPEPGAYRSELPAAYARTDASGRTRRAGRGESIRDA